MFSIVATWGFCDGPRRTLCLDCAVIMPLLGPKKYRSCLSGLLDGYHGPPSWLRSTVQGCQLTHAFLQHLCDSRRWPEDIGQVTYQRINANNVKFKRMKDYADDERWVLFLCDTDRLSQQNGVIIAPNSLWTLGCEVCNRGPVASWTRCPSKKAAGSRGFLTYQWRFAGVPLLGSRSPWGSSLRSRRLCPHVRRRTSPFCERLYSLGYTAERIVRGSKGKDAHMRVCDAHRSGLHNCSLTLNSGQDPVHPLLSRYGLILWEQKRRFYLRRN